MNFLWRLPRIKLYVGKHTIIIENPISRRYITGTHHGKYIDYEMSEQNKTETVYSLDKPKPKKNRKQNRKKDLYEKDFKTDETETRQTIPQIVIDVAEKFTRGRRTFQNEKKVQIVSCPGADLGFSRGRRILKKCSEILIFFWSTKLIF